MRLRTVLIVLFTTVSVVQLVAVAPIALRDLSRLLESQHAARVGQGVRAAKTVIARDDADVLRALDELAASEALETVARAAKKEPLPTEVAQAAQPLMGPRRLDVLAVLDEQGKTLSSGHFPEQLLELDPGLLAITTEPPESLHAALVTLPSSEGLVSRPARLAARPVDFGERRVWVVGGRLLSTAWAEELARLSGGRLEVQSQGAVVASAGEALGQAGTRRVLFDGPTATVGLVFSRAEVNATRRQVLGAFAALFALGLVLALAVSAVVSRRVTRPVEALTSAAERIAQGELQGRVDEAGAKEVRALVHAFNRMTSDLQAATERLIASERLAAWQEVARRLAHEVKNPLTPIRLSLETLRALAERNDPRLREMLLQSSQLVLDEVQRLARIVDEFSHFARLPKPKPAPVDLVSLARDVVQLHAPRGLTVSVEAEGPASALADKDLLTQVLVNVVKNAAEAMGGQGRLVLRAGVEGPWATLEALDSGPGFPPELLPRLFEPYVTTKPQGTGLGLALTRRIVEEHQGQLEATNRPEGGARIAIRLPRSTAG